MKQNDHNKLVGSEIERSDERIKETGEVFTPLTLCNSMIDKLGEDILKNPESTFMDNCAGSGNFLVALKNRLCKYHSEEHIVNKMLYAVELMPDNHAEMCQRIGVSTCHPHFVCADALRYDYSFGEPIGLEGFMS